MGILEFSRTLGRNSFSPVRSGPGGKQPGIDAGGAPKGSSLRMKVTLQKVGEMSGKNLRP